MAADLITPDNITKERLKEMFDAAYMETSYDDDGDLRVKDGGIGCFVMPHENRIKLMSLFGAEDHASRSQLLEFANNVNDDYIMVRVSVTKKGRICADFDIPMADGIPAKTIVLATKRFIKIVVQSFREYGSDVLK